MLEINITAPDFNLHASPDLKVSLKEFRGKNMVLAFYPADWSPVCSDQMSLYSEILASLHKFNAEILGISVDGKWCHAAFLKERDLHFKLLADFEPKGAVAKKYGVYNEKEGRAERALFVLDQEGVIRWNYLSPPGINPGAEGILKALETLTRNR